MFYSCSVLSYYSGKMVLKQCKTCKMQLMTLMHLGNLFGATWIALTFNFNVLSPHHIRGYSLNYAGKGKGKMIRTISFRKDNGTFDNVEFQRPNCFPILVNQEEYNKSKCNQKSITLNIFFHHILINKTCYYVSFTSFSLKDFPDLKL